MGEVEADPRKKLTTLVSAQYAPKPTKSKPLKPGWNTRKAHYDEEEEKDEKLKN